MNIIDVDLQFRRQLQSMGEVRKLVQHHLMHRTWGIRDTHLHHRDTNLWNGVGYGWQVNQDGKIYKGRGFHKGAHVRGHNDNTLGVAHQGNFMVHKMNDEQLQSSIWLNWFIIQKFPNLNWSHIVGHNDLASTSCPGRFFRMSELREGVHKLIEGGEDQPMDLSNYQWDRLVRTLEKMHREGRFKSERWIKKAKARELTDSEMIWLLTVTE